MQEQLKDVFKTAIDGGITYFDTAEVGLHEPQDLTCKA